MNNQAAQTMPELRELAQRAIPFLRDEGSNYEDDGNNEPLELARAIEAALAGNPNRDAANPGGCECEKCGRVFIGAEWHVLCGICVDHGVAQPDGSGLRNGDNVSASTPEASPQPQVTNPAYTACNVEGTWLWGKLMDWCRAHRTSPASFDSLFAIAREAHQANQQAGHNRLINNDLDEKSTSEQAALSQAAGVPDVLFDGYAVYQGMTDEARARINAGGVSDVLDSVVRLIRAQAAQAASGVHPDALQDGTLSKSTAKRVEALAAASVSERARELLAAEYDNEGVHGLAESIRAGTFTTHLDQCSINAITNALASAPDGFALVPVEPTEAMKDAGDYSKWNYDDAADIYKAMLRAAGYAARGTKEPVFALEQALTQQRGHGTTGSMEQAEKATFVPCDCGCGRSCCAMCGNDVGFLTPQPSADAVRELVKRWRDEAGQLLEDHGGDRAAVCVADAMRSMTDELESLLSGGSHA